MNKGLLLIPENESNLLELRGKIDGSTGFLECMKESDLFLKKIVAVFEDFLFEMDVTKHNKLYLNIYYRTKILNYIIISKAGLAKSSTLYK